MTTASRKRRRRLPPGLALLLLPAFIAEALSGATPPVAYFLNPFVFAYLTLYYGTGALLVREMTRRWGKGWPTLLLLGGVWGIVQEGLGTKVFFDPTRTELSPLVNYGTTGGVHWAFVVQLFIYHGIYSIVLPIMLSEVIYWSERDRSWAGKRALWICVFLQVAMTAVAYQTISPNYKPPAELYVSTLLATAVLIFLARWLPGRSPDPAAPPALNHHVPRPRWFLLVGCLSSSVFILVSLVGPGWIGEPLVVIALMLGITAYTLWILRKASQRGRAWSRPHQLALATGLLAPLIVWSPVQELSGVTGKSLVGVAVAVFLWLTWRRIGSPRIAHPLASPPEESSGGVGP
jgi:hypothetical protein